METPNTEIAVPYEVARLIDCAICGIMEGWVEFHEEDETTTVQKMDTTEREI